VTDKKKAAVKAGSEDESLRKHIVELLKGGNAHVGFMDALKNLPPSVRGTFAAELPHTAWQLLEHMRIAQWDILEFSHNAKHVSPEFPEGYWPKTPVPPSEAAWNKSVKVFQNDLQKMIALVSDRRVNLHAVLPWGDGQTVLREALVLADHNAYHLGQLVDLGRALKVWPQS